MDGIAELVYLIKWKSECDCGKKNLMDIFICYDENEDIIKQ